MSNDEKNPFGGGNPHGLYVPMSPDEQEVIARLVESQDLEVVVHGWGVSENPHIIFGDLRVTVPITIDFNGLAGPTTIHYFDLELRTQAGMRLIKQRMPLNPPQIVHNGMFLEMAWDIAIDHMDPNLVKMIKPGAVGLTSRRLDRETRERTEHGNMDLDDRKKFQLKMVDGGAAKIRADDAKRAVKATKAAGEEIKETSQGVLADD
jgi:hypothetical protein